MVSTTKLPSKFVRELLWTRLTWFSTGTITCLPSASRRRRSCWRSRRARRSWWSTTASRSAGSTRAPRGRTPQTSRWATLRRIFTLGTWNMLYYHGDFGKAGLTSIQNETVCKCIKTIWYTFNSKRAYQSWLILTLDTFCKCIWRWWNRGRQVARLWLSTTRFCHLLFISNFLFIVASNHQTDDRQNLLNRAMFAGNGGCGYILKPRW